jgi:hypothetical protein
MMANKNGSNTCFHLYRGPEAFVPQKGGHLLCQTWETLANNGGGLPIGSLT